MRLSLEIILVAALISLGWQKPFREWLSPASAPLVQPSNETGPAPERAAARSTAAPSGAWMWDKQRKTSLDRGAYHQDSGVARAPEFYYRPDAGMRVDQYGRHYWVDQNGVRHYH